MRVIINSYVFFVFVLSFLDILEKIEKLKYDIGYQKYGEDFFIGGAQMSLDQNSLKVVKMLIIYILPNFYTINKPEAHRETMP